MQTVAAKYRSESVPIFSIVFDLTLFSKINTCSTDNDVTYIIMPRIAQESSIYLFPLWSLVSTYFHCGHLKLP